MTGTPQPPAFRPVNVPDLILSTAAQAEQSTRLRLRVLDRHGPALIACAARIAAAFQDGATLFTFGDGGDTDAQALAQLFLTPGRTTAQGPRPLPALFLAGDASPLTAPADDAGLEGGHARHLAALGRRGDVAVALSTSGGSANALPGLRQARRIGMLTVAFAGGDSGGDSGPIAAQRLADHLFVIPSSSPHRIQEAQSTACHVLWELVQQQLAQP